MGWGNSIDTKDKFFAAIVYILPLIYALNFGQFALQKLPFLAIIYLPIKPIIQFYYGFPFGGLIIFFVLFLAVVRNQNISYFIRFNTMQSILIDIFLSLCSIVTQFFFSGLGASLLTETLFNVLFLGTLGVCFYSMIQSAFGRYADIPTISDAVKSQVPW
jgi:Chloroplast import apparatus Tic20-like